MFHWHLQISPYCKYSLCLHFYVCLFTVNLTPFGTASMSSFFGGSTPENAILPTISNAFSLGLCAHTNHGDDPSPDWWMFQFSFEFAYITNITIYYREDCKYSWFQIWYFVLLGWHFSPFYLIKLKMKR